jgi:hypothetical protein
MLERIRSFHHLNEANGSGRSLARMSVRLTSRALSGLMWSVTVSGFPTTGPTRVPSTAPTRTPTMAPTALAASISLLSRYFSRGSSSIPVVNPHEALVFRGSTNYAFTNSSWTSSNATLRAAIGTQYHCTQKIGWSRVVAHPSCLRVSSCCALDTLASLAASGSPHFYTKLHALHGPMD